jgi:hypothetical protein
VAVAVGVGVVAGLVGGVAGGAVDTGGGVGVADDAGVDGAVGDGAGVIVAAGGCVGVAGGGPLRVVPRTVARTSPSPRMIATSAKAAEGGAAADVERTV